MQLAVWFPSVVFTVIVASPGAMPLTSHSPFSFTVTVAIPVLLLSHVTFLFVALSGATVAVRVVVPPTVRLAELLSRVTPVTATVAALTVTVQLASFPPSAVVTVISAVPALTALTLPSASTVATEGSLDFQLTALYVASEGVIVAVSLSVSLGFISAVVLSSSTLVTAFVNVTFPLPLVFSTVPLPFTVMSTLV